MTADPRPSLEDDLLFGLHDVFADATDTAVGTALQEPRFVVTPATTRRMARQAQPPLEAPIATPAPAGTAPAAATARRKRQKRREKSAGAPIPRVASPAAPATRTTRAAPTGTSKGNEPTKLAPSARPDSAEAGAATSAVGPATPPSPIKVDAEDGSTVPTTSVSSPQGVVDPPKAQRGHDDRDLLGTPELRRGLSANLERMENILRDPAQLAHAQRHLPYPRPAGVGQRQRNDTNHVLSDNGLLWHAPRGWMYAIAVSRQLVPGVLAHVHGTYGHPGIVRTTLLIERKFHWPTLKSDVRAYVLSCPCRRRKRARSMQLSMMPARLLRPWEVLQMDIQDKKVKCDKGNQNLQVVVDRASKFLAAFALPSKDALGVSRKLLELLLKLGLPLSIRSDMGSENTPE